MQIKVDVDRCVGGGQCVLSAPDLFDQDDDDGTVILLGQPDSGQHDEARLAARLCPATAIDIKE
ncbi:MAG: ferredoxin [Actinomycetota bacterium]|nr:ferredoxin [Actinomycetota bacterium]